MSLHTKLALRTGGLLVFLSIIVYLITEKNLGQFASEMSPVNRFINIIFMAITPRTAGLTTIPYDHLSSAGI